MTEAAMSRRKFLEASGRAAAGAVMLTAAGGTTILMASDGAWAMSLETLSGQDSMTLLKALRVIYPHDALGDQYYAEVVAALDADAKADAAKAALLKDGVAGLDQAMPVPFLDLSEGNQLQVLEAIQDTDFFQALRSKTIVTLYNNERIWEAFGYEGPSYEYGGYIERGFNDLGWLPDPPPEASPPVEL
jgi:hypothetical protein